MHINRKKAVSNRPLSQRGFTLLQVIVVLALISILTAFGTVGVVKGRAYMRLAGSARTFAGLAEKARADSVRRHAMGAAMSNMLLLTSTSYSVTMDFDNNGVIDGSDTRTFNLDTNVSFDPNFVGTSITFDWRGRSVTGQVNPILRLSGPATDAALITISGSGDITMNAEGFPDNSIPDVVLNINPTGDIRPDPPPNPLPIGVVDPNATPTPVPTPTPPPDPNATPYPTPEPTPQPTPTPCENHGVNCRPTPTPTPVPTPTPDPTPSPTPTAGACTLSASPTSLTLVNKATATVTLGVADAGGSTTVSLSGNTNGPHISVTLAPGQTGIVNGSGTVTFVVTMNGHDQTGVLTFSASSPCSVSRTVPVNP
jgi:prepilin-type N-terminal cleavage/methylation domain-containing protein